MEALASDISEKPKAKPKKEEKVVVENTESAT
jgi:hypothetical protein